MENFEKIERLLQSKAYQELTEAEREIVRATVITEDEYESLRNAEVRLTNYFSLKAEVDLTKNGWEQIKSTLKQKKAEPKFNFWTATPLPTYATLLLLLAVGFVCWVGGSQISPKILDVARAAQRVDTVFIATKPDTIYKERVVYLKAPSLAPTFQTVKSLRSVPNQTSKGVNMKDKEELEKLLVSGSE